MKFKEMGNWSKVLFVVGWLCVIRYILNLILGIISMMNAELIGDAILKDYIDLSGTGMTPTQAILLSGVVLISICLVGLLASRSAIRAARNQGKVTFPLIYMGIVIVDFAVILIAGGFTTNYILSFLLFAVGFVACIMVKKKKTESASINNENEA